MHAGTYFGLRGKNRGPAPALEKTGQNILFFQKTGNLSRNPIPGLYMKRITEHLTFYCTAVVRPRVICEAFRSGGLSQSRQCMLLIFVSLSLLDATATGRVLVLSLIYWLAAVWGIIAAYHANSGDDGVDLFFRFITLGVVFLLRSLYLVILPMAMISALLEKVFPALGRHRWSSSIIILSCLAYILSNIVIPLKKIGKPLLS
ncbi:MAG: hypothetical protein EXS37_20070 [Opitutus sp.]|nr:hypothetical protein [Opitutus sp.]